MVYRVILCGPVSGGYFMLYSDSTIVLIFREGVVCVSVFPFLNRLP